MRFFKWLVFGFLICLLFTDCNKKEFNAINNIRYEVRVLDSSAAVIKYYSDLYHERGAIEEILINDSTNIYYGNTWFATRRKPAIEEDYFIEVTFTRYENPNNERHGVFVYVNDTSLVDSFTMVSQPSPIILKGRIPKSID